MGKLLQRSVSISSFFILLVVVDGCFSKGGASMLAHCLREMSAGFAAPVSEQVITSTGRLHTLMTQLMTSVTGWHADFKNEAQVDRKDTRAIIRNIEATDKKLSAFVDKLDGLVDNLAKLSEVGNVALAAQTTAANEVTGFFRHQAALLGTLPLAPQQFVPAPSPEAALAMTPQATNPLLQHLRHPPPGSGTSSGSSRISGGLGDFLQNLRGVFTPVSHCQMTVCLDVPRLMSHCLLPHCLLSIIVAHLGTPSISAFKAVQDGRNEMDTADGDLPLHETVIIGGKDGEDGSAATASLPDVRHVFFMVCVHVWPFAWA